MCHWMRVKRSYSLKQVTVQQAFRQKIVRVARLLFMEVKRRDLPVIDSYVCNNLLLARKSGRRLFSSIYSFSY